MGPDSGGRPSHVLSLWKQVGDFRLADLEKLSGDEKKLLSPLGQLCSSLSYRDYPLYYS